MEAWSWDPCQGGDDGAQPSVIRAMAIALPGVIVYGGFMLMLDGPTGMRLLDFAKSATARSGDAAIDGVPPAP